VLILKQITDQSRPRTIKRYYRDWSVERSDFMKMSFWNLRSSSTAWQQVQTFLRHFLKVFLENGYRYHTAKIKSALTLILHV